VVTAPIGHIQLAPLTVLGAGRRDRAGRAARPRVLRKVASLDWPANDGGFGVAHFYRQGLFGVAHLYQQFLEDLREGRPVFQTSQTPSCDTEVSRMLPACPNGSCSQSVPTIRANGPRSPAVACLTWRYRHRGCHKTAGPEVGLWTATVLRGLSTYPRHQPALAMSHPAEGQT